MNFNFLKRKIQIFDVILKFKPVLNFFRWSNHNLISLLVGATKQNSWLINTRATLNLLFSPVIIEVRPQKLDDVSVFSLWQWWKESLRELACFPQMFLSWRCFGTFSKNVEFVKSKIGFFVMIFWFSTWISRSNVARSPSLIPFTFCYTFGSPFLFFDSTSNFAHVRILQTTKRKIGAKWGENAREWPSTIEIFSKNGCHSGTGPTTYRPSLNYDYNKISIRSCHLLSLLRCWG